MKYLVLLMIFFSMPGFTLTENSLSLDGFAGNKLESCVFNGKNLYGKVKLVERSSQADVTIQIVNSFPDLKVKFVEHFPDDCGEWQIVERGEDLKVYITDSFADIKVMPVSSFPGL